MVTLQALKVLKDSPLRDPGQIPFPSSTPAVKNPPVPIDEEDMASIRELVEQIDTHVELDDTEATSNPCVSGRLGEDTLLRPITD